MTDDEIALWLITKGTMEDKHVLSLAADRILTLRAERDRGFVMLMERAERAEAEVARLTALLPHPGETVDEVMWRNHQRGVPLAELAKAAKVTKERARYKLLKVEMRMKETKK